MRWWKVSALMLLIGAGLCAGADDDDEDEDPYTSMDPKKREPSPCEVCKYFVTELKSRLDESAKSKEVIETGHGLDLKKKRFKFITSELRLTEALHEPHICEKILEYNVHAERKGSLRYAKGQSETMSTLHGLVNKGVKVELGMPYEMWDQPSAEVSKMQRYCFSLAEQYEDDIENWYYNNQELNLAKYICQDRYLKHKNWDGSCLDELFLPKGDDGEDGNGESGKKKKKKKKKGKKSKKGDSGTEDGPPSEIPPEGDTKAQDKDEL